MIDLIPPANPTAVPSLSFQVPIETGAEDDFLSAVGMINSRSFVAIEDEENSGQYELWASDRRPNGTIRGSWNEIGQPTPTNNRNPAIATKQSGGSSNDGAMIVFSSGSDIYGVLWNDTPSGSLQTLPTGCGGLGLQATGDPVIGSSVAFQLTNSSGQGMLWLGLTQFPFPLCSGCILNAQIGIVSPATSLPPLPIPCDANVVGGLLYFQGLDVGVPGGCTGLLDYRLSDTIKITIGG